MALETVVFQQDRFVHNGCPSKELFNLFHEGNWILAEEQEEEFAALKIEEDEDQTTGSFFYNNDDLLENPTQDFLRGENDVKHSWNSSSPPPYNSLLLPDFDELFNQTNPTQEANPSPGIGSVLPAPLASDHLPQLESTPGIVDPPRPWRRRPRSRKNKEEIENKRMTHIAVERNRRKQMKEYLSVLRSLMPQSYVQRGDHASIIGGAINFVKKLEQRLQLVSTAQKEVQENSDVGDHISWRPFSEFFKFPQYSTMSGPILGETRSSTVADIEVTMVESHASLKIRSKRRPKQLLVIVSGLQSMRLTVLHLNVTTRDQVVLYSLSVKVEDDCKLTSVDEIATAVHQMLGRIIEEGSASN